MEPLYIQALAQVLGNGFLVAVLWAWAKGKGDKIDRIDTNVNHIRNQSDARDEGGHLLIYKDKAIVAILEKLATTNEVQTEILREIRQQQAEIRSGIDKSNCPYGGGKKDV